MRASQNYGYLFGVPIVKIIVVRDLYWAPVFREAATWSAWVLADYIRGGSSLVQPALNMWGLLSSLG